MPILAPRAVKKAPTRCRRCKLITYPYRVLWIRLGCELISSDRQPGDSLPSQALYRQHAKGACRGAGCDGCVFRSTEGRFYAC